jgi:hypothetical protein
MEYVNFCTCIRFGGKGAIKDNASAGGGFCNVSNDGIIGDAIFRYQSLVVRKRSEENIGSNEIPNYQSIIDCAISLHKQLPHFDLIGWDFAIDENADPVMIEFNITPALEIPQIANGPILGEYLDDILPNIAIQNNRLVFRRKKCFSNKRGFSYDYLEI